MEDKFDLIVIGAGSGGLASAKRAASYGANVAVIEGSEIGGTCVIRGCVPKKLMVYAAKNRQALYNSDAYGLTASEKSFSSRTLLNKIRNEVLRLSEIHRKSMEKLNIKVFKGWGRFLNKKEVQILSSNKKKVTKSIYGEKILIAVGGEPNILNVPGKELAWTSDDIFRLDQFPKSITIIGGGYIACEFACIFNDFGIEVNQIIRRDSLLTGFDTDLSAFLKDEMVESGIKLKFKEELESINQSGLGLEISLHSGSTLHSDNLLMATGRSPRINDLNLSNIGIKMIGKYIEVDEVNQTNVSNVFAIGDVVDKPNLTPVAIEQGRVFSDNIFGNLKRVVNYEYIPKAVFTNPEISTVGLTESEAKELYTNENIEIFKCAFTPMSNTFKVKKSKSMLKLVVNKLDNRVLGCHMFGESSSEIIQMASVAINAGVTKEIFDMTMALHPTVSEEFVTMYR